MEREIRWSLEEYIPAKNFLKKLVKIFRPGEEEQHVVVDPDTGYDGFSQVDITVEAISPDYVGSDIPHRDSDDLVVNTNYPNAVYAVAEAGYYESRASKQIPNGTEGTPSCSIDIVSHAASIVPSVTNTEGYIRGGTRTGRDYTVSASDLTSGTMNITTNGTKNVTNYQRVSVNVSGGISTPPKIKITWDKGMYQGVISVYDETNHEYLSYTETADGRIFELPTEDTDLSFEYDAYDVEFGGVSLVSAGACGLQAQITVGSGQPWGELRFSALDTTWVYEALLY